MGKLVNFRKPIRKLQINLSLMIFGLGVIYFSLLTKQTDNTSNRYTYIMLLVLAITGIVLCVRKYIKGEVK